MTVSSHLPPVLQAARAALSAAPRVAVLTGAGMSADSGIPTFRDALTGLWSRFDAQALATPGAFQRDPALVWGWYEWRRMKALQAQPHAGHLALADWANAKLVRHGPGAFTLITQNVDDLHERAGHADVRHLHGSLHAPRCARCGRRHVLAPGVPAEPEGGRRLAPPACAHCGGPVRPGVVWFGESLPPDVWAEAERAVRQCDALLVIGTSGQVHPAAGLADLAHARGVPVVVLNPDATLAREGLGVIGLPLGAAQGLPALLSPQVT